MKHLSFKIDDELMEDLLKILYQKKLAKQKQLGNF